MVSRRRFLGMVRYPAAAALATTWAPPGALAAAADRIERLARGTAGPAELAADESFWLEVQQAFTVDRSLVNLNNGGVSPSPLVVQTAMKRHLDVSNTLPPYTLWQILEPQREGVRQRLARQLGCDAEEMALTRNTSEGMETVQLGLTLRQGDEVLTTDQDYPRMINTFKQRARRDGIVLRLIDLPDPGADAEEVVARFKAAITPRTRVILVSHVIFLNGRVLPVREIVRLGRAQGVPVIVDGAHSFAHLDFTLNDLECDFFATSLHKWLLAPHGTGFLFVRRDRIGDLWPLFAAPDSMDKDIRKFEEIGTHPAANTLAVAEALTFHQAIGPARKLARLVYLRDYWARRLLSGGRIRLHTSLAPGLAAGIATFQAPGLDSAELSRRLWDKHRIFTISIKHAQYEGVRVSPNVYTTIEELDRFCEAVESEVKGAVA